MSIVEIKIPSPGESITEVEIGNWLKADGDYVLIDETICEIETDKATLPLVAESAGRLKILLQEGETAGIGDVACSIDTDAEQPKITSTPTSSEVIVKSEEPSERATIQDEASSVSAASTYKDARLEPQSKAAVENRSRSRSRSRCRSGKREARRPHAAAE